MPDLHVVRAGPQTTVQDRGRPGYAALGVPRSGALDQPALALANRLVGNAVGRAGLECVVGGLVLEASESTVLAVTGAQVPVVVGGRAVPWGTAVPLPAGATFSLGAASRGLRVYLAAAGGIAVDEVLGSRSTDLLSGLGPPVLADDDRLPLGVPDGPPGPGEAVPALASGVLRLRLGPRDDAFDPASVAALDGASYVVGEASNRIGLRLLGDPITRRGADELASEGMVLGAVQVPPDGQPVVFLADHPVTGGYPVVAVLEPADLALCAQLRPGERVTLRVIA